MGVSRHVIDDTELIQPHVRLCHRILADALASGYGLVEFVSSHGEMPIARAQVGGGWKPLMAFPPPVFEMLVGYLKQMVAVAPEGEGTHDTILVQWAGTHASITMNARRGDQGLEELVLRFPPETT